MGSLIHRAGVVGATLTLLLAGLVLVSGSLDEPVRVRSTEFTTADQRTSELASIVALDTPVTDVLFDITTMEGVMTPGPPGIDACIVISVPKSELPRWTSGWSEETVGMGLGISCARDLARGNPDFDLRGVYARYRRSDAAPIDVGEERSVFADSGVVIWRIVR